jgi:hypothetical protein
VTTVTTFNPGKSVMKYSAVQIQVYYFFYVGPQVTIFLAESSVISSLKFFVVIFYAAVIWSVLGLSPSVLFGALSKDTCICGHVSYCNQYMPLCKCIYY